MAGSGMALGLFVGVDSGGTRTNVHLKLMSSGAEAPIESSYEVSESLSGTLPVEMISPTLRRILIQLEAEVENVDTMRKLPVYVWVSAAGFTPWTRDTYIVAANDLAPEVLGGRIRSIGAANDAVSLLLGSGGDAIIIAGTGSSVLVRERNGDLFQAGGHEWVACDYGSGFWIGLRAIREAYRDFENGHTRSVLLQRLYEQYGVSPDDGVALVQKLRRLSIGQKDLKKEIARFAPAVCAAAERGDKQAQNLVKLEAEDLADCTAAALRRHFNIAALADGLRLIECGGVLRNDFYRTSFEAQVEMRLLSGSDRKAAMAWERVTSGADICVRLAEQLSEDATVYEGVDAAFRPAIVEF